MVERDGAAVEITADAYGRYGLAVVAGVHDVSATSGELGAWALGMRLEPGELRQVDLVLRPAVSIEGAASASRGRVFGRGESGKSL